MTQFIKCLECGNCIGKYIEFVEKAKISLYNDTIYSKDAKYSNYNPEKMIFDSVNVPSMEHIFEAIGINNRCCRMHLMTKKEFNYH